jgi:hypothetical protein
MGVPAWVLGQKLFSPFGTIARLFKWSFMVLNGNEVVPFGGALVNTFVISGVSIHWVVKTFPWHLLHFVHTFGRPIRVRHLNQTSGSQNIELVSIFSEIILNSASHRRNRIVPIRLLYWVHTWELLPEPPIVFFHDTFASWLSVVNQWICIFIVLSRCHTLLLSLL